MPVEDFEHLVTRILEGGEQDLERQLSLWYQSPDVDFVAVPITRLGEPNPLVALLEAARIPVERSGLVTTDNVVNISLGPLAVEAFRLLRSYLAGLDPRITDDDPVVRRLHRIAARRAKALGWCDERFWGWTPEQAAVAADTLGPSNERFAQAVWGTPWPLPLPVDRPANRAELMTVPAGELDRVHDFVVAMAKRYATLRAEQGKT
jgi:hypothetical protein